MITLWAVSVLLISLYAFFDIFFGISRLESLASFQPIDQNGALPKVSVIVPACNEEQQIEQTVTSLLTQEYTNYEIIIVNDRSTDATGTLLKKLSLQNPQLQIVHIESLPEGWLGKNNALQHGADIASGDVLLFTDGDIMQEETTLARAVAVIERRQLDHLCLIFKNTTSGKLLNSVIIDALTGLFLMLKPWKVKDPKSKYFTGIGAFNMIRTDVYRQIGGHARNRMHPIDDIILGMTVKMNGYSQDCLRGEDFVTVRWYESLAEMVNGLMKNVFAMYNYRLSFATAALIFITAYSILPPWGILLCTGPSRLICIAIVLLRLLSFSKSRACMGLKSPSCLWSLLTPYIIVFIIAKSAFTTLLNKGIYWRGTYYPLEQLKMAEPILTWRWITQRR